MADFKTEYEEHLSTWGPNCGASLKTYKGHLDRMLAPLHQEIAELRQREIKPEAVAAVAKLHGEIAELRKDKARLDWWLREHSEGASIPAWAWEEAQDAAASEDPLICGRLAIDAAMESE